MSMTMTLKFAIRRMALKATTYKFIRKFSEHSNFCGPAGFSEFLVLPSAKASSNPFDRWSQNF
jgi:hypothetical protein